MSTGDARIEYLDKQGTPATANVCGLKLTIGKRTWFYACSQGWGVGETKVGYSDDVPYLSLVPVRGCAATEAATAAPKQLFGVKNWALVSLAEWKRLSKALQAQGDNWPHAAALGLSGEGRIWVRDKPGQSAENLTGRLRKSRPGETASRVFCSPLNAASSTPARRRQAVAKQWRWPPRPHFVFYDGRDKVLFESSDPRLDLADTLMLNHGKRSRTLWMGIRSNGISSPTWTEERLLHVEQLINYDLEFDGYAVRKFRVSRKRGRPCSEEFVWELRIRTR